MWSSVVIVGCKAKEVEKIVYVEVPVDVERTTTVTEAGEVITKTQTTTTTIISPAQTVEDASVADTAGSLALSTNISLVPPKTNEGSSLRQALLSSDMIPTQIKPNSNLRLSLASSDYDDFSEEIVTWNQAQKPLDSLNSFLCVIAKTKYNIEAEIDRLERAAKAGQTAGEFEVDTTYIAKVTLKECFKSSSNMANTQNNNAGVSLPTDITVRVTKKANEPLETKFWFTAKLSEMSSNQQGMIDVGSEPRKRSYYMQLAIAEPVSSENPFGLFDFKWTAYDLEEAVENDSINGDGYVKVFRQALTNDLMLQFYDSTTSQDLWSADWSSTVSNQAIAKLDVKPLLDENKEIIGYNIKGGDALTAMNYSWNYTGTNANMNYGGNNNSGSYSLAFDEDSVVTKYNMAASNTVAYNSAQYSPEDPLCSTRNEVWANVYEYALFDEAGKRISHQTGFMIETGKTHPEWGYPMNGWISRWGMWLEGVSEGETVRTVNWETGEKTEMIYATLNGKLLDNMWQDITLSQPTNLELTCSSQCPKATITQNDLDLQTPFMPNLVAPDTYTYTYDVANKVLKYLGNEVKIAANANAIGTPYEWGNLIDAQMTDSSANSFRYQMSLRSYDRPAGLRLKNANGTAGAWFVVPDPIEFEPFTYSDALHSYADNNSLANDGNIYHFVMDGYLSGIPWESKTGRRDQWGNNQWGPEIVLRRGVELVAANTTGTITAGDRIKLAPKVTQHTAKDRNFLTSGDIGVTRDGCSLSLQERALWIEHDFTLPLAIAGQDIKAEIGPAPTKNAADEDLLTRYVEGETTR
jgi:hypothetical protein